LQVKSSAPAGGRPAAEGGGFLFQDALEILVGRLRVADVELERRYGKNLTYSSIPVYI